MMLYPLKFIPIYKELVWGGRGLELKYNRKLPHGKNIGESWELTNREEGKSIISNGFLKGKTIGEAAALYPFELFGKAYAKYQESFPLLIKLIDANDTLSIQVHPDGEQGKTEAWYILEACEGAEIIYGLKDEIGKPDFENAIRTNRVKDLVKAVPVKAGEVYFIPAGRVHALGKGILVAEIQQNSNTTYRIYDWDRVGLDGKPRQLHIEEALEAIDFENSSICCPGVNSEKNDSWMKKTLVDCKYFTVDEISIISKYHNNLKDDIFEIIMPINGCFNIIYENEKKETASAIETIMVPSSLGSYTIEGEGKLLRTFIKC